jgi:hypothetical protein
MAERRTVRSRRDEAEPDEVEPDEAEAEADAQREDARDAAGDEPRGRRRPRRQSEKTSAAQAAQAGLREIVELTGKEPEGVTGVEPGDDGWIVGVEVVEDRRVPSSADILAVYEAELDMGGNLLSYRRLQRYPRGKGSEAS